MVDEMVDNEIMRDEMVNYEKICYFIISSINKVVGVSTDSIHTHLG